MADIPLRFRADAHQATGEIDRLNRSMGNVPAHAARAERAIHGMGVASGIATGVLRVGAIAATAAFTGLAVAVTRQAFTTIKHLGQLQQLSAQTAAVIKSTGGVAGVTATQVVRLADSLNRMSGAGDEAIRAGENILLTFTNIREVGPGTNAIFTQATKAALDMSIAMKIDLPQAAKQLGKALQDPLVGMTALRRVGVAFNAAQREQIKTLVESGHTLEAQKIILKELQVEFGGSARAAGETFPGKLKRLREAWEDVTDRIGMGFMPTIERATNFMLNTVAPAAQQTANKIAMAWERKDLTPAEKFAESWKIIEETGVPAKVGDAILSGLGKVALRGPVFFWNAFTQAPWPAKAAMTTLFLAKFGPALSAVGSKLVSVLVGSLGGAAVGGKATGITSTVAGVAAARGATPANPVFVFDVSAGAAAAQAAGGAGAAGLLTGATAAGRPLFGASGVLAGGGAALGVGATAALGLGIPLAAIGLISATAGWGPGGFLGGFTGGETADEKEAISWAEGELRRRHVAPAVALRLLPSLIRQGLARVATRKAREQRAIAPNIGPLSFGVGATQGVTRAAQYGRAQLGPNYVYGAGPHGGAMVGPAPDLPDFDCSSLAAAIASQVEGYSGGWGTTVTLRKQCKRKGRKTDPIVWVFLPAGDKPTHMYTIVQGEIFNAHGRKTGITQTASSPGRGGEDVMIPPGLEWTVTGIGGGTGAKGRVRPPDATGGVRPGGAVTAGEINRFLKQKGSPLAGLGTSFIAAGQQYAVDPRLLVAIAGGETSFGTTGNAAGLRNPFGLGPGNRYPSWQAAIMAAARTLANYRSGPRGASTLADIQKLWAPIGAANDPTGLNRNWIGTISSILTALGGDPNAPFTSPTPYTTTLKPAPLTPAQVLERWYRRLPASVTRGVGAAGYTPLQFRRLPEALRPFAIAGLPRDMAASLRRALGITPAAAVGGRPLADVIAGIQRRGEAAVTAAGGVEERLAAEGAPSEVAAAFGEKAQRQAELAQLRQERAAYVSARSGLQAQRKRLARQRAQSIAQSRKARGRTQALRRVLAAIRTQDLKYRDEIVKINAALEDVDIRRRAAGEKITGAERTIAAAGTGDEAGLYQIPKPTISDRLAGFRDETLVTRAGWAATDAATAAARAPGSEGGAEITPTEQENISYAGQRAELDARMGQITAERNRAQSDYDIAFARFQSARQKRNTAIRMRRKARANAWGPLTKQIADLKQAMDDAWADMMAAHDLIADLDAEAKSLGFEIESLDRSHAQALANIAPEAATAATPATPAITPAMEQAAAQAAVAARQGQVATAFAQALGTSRDIGGGVVAVNVNVGGSLVTQGEVSKWLVDLLGRQGQFGRG